MAIKKRKSPRFRETGKVFIPDLCIFPGLLVDISSSGCCIRFPAIVEPDTDTDYEASFTLSVKPPLTPFKLILQPRWKKDMPSATEIGFEFLHSPGTKNLVAHIEDLAKAASV